MYPRGGASVCRGQQGCDVCAALPMPTTTHHRRRFALSPKVQTTKELTKGTRGGCQTRLCQTCTSHLCLAKFHVQILQCDWLVNSRLRMCPTNIRVI